MKKRTTALSIRCTPEELRATKRYAKHFGKDMSGLIRDQIFNHALRFDPKQFALFIYGKDGPPPPRP